MHISEKLAEAQKTGQPVFSFEYFPPKTAQGVQNLYERINRMHDWGPAFIDVTCFGLETNMHLTCTDMEISKVNDALDQAYKAGCTNILALRGDPPRENEKWVAKEGGFRYALDLVKYIKKK